MVFGRWNFFDVVNYGSGFRGEEDSGLYVIKDGWSFFVEILVILRLLLVDEVMVLSFLVDEVNILLKLEGYIEYYVFDIYGVLGIKEK